MKYLLLLLLIGCDTKGLIQYDNIKYITEYERSTTIFNKWSGETISLIDLSIIDFDGGSTYMVVGTTICIIGVKLNGTEFDGTLTIFDSQCPEYEGDYIYTVSERGFIYLEGNQIIKLERINE